MGLLLKKSGRPTERGTVHGKLIMAAESTTSVGVPIKLLHEGAGQVVIVELKTGEAYRGTLLEAEDTMNCQLKDGQCSLAALWLAL